MDIDVTKRPVCLAYLGSLLLALAGCQQEEGVQRYQVPRLESKVRLLGAIVPQGERTWFFKLAGPASDVDEHEASFREFIQSVRFPSGGTEPITWKVPAGWKQEAASKLRYATFRIGPSQALELTVIPLGRDAGSLLENVNRWRQNDVGLPPLANAQLKDVIRDGKIGGSAATLVDMTGPGTKGLAMAKPRLESPRTSLKYQVPAGWEEQSNLTAMRAAAFTVRDGAQSAEVTVIPLSGPAGGLLANVNRWRGQIKLKDVTEDELKRDLKPFDVGGLPGAYVDLLGPEEPQPRQRVLGVVVAHNQQTWFIKLMGPADLIEKQRAAFEQFVRSVKFDGGTGANP